MPKCARCGVDICYQTVTSNGFEQSIACDALPPDPGLLGPDRNMTIAARNGKMVHGHSPEAPFPEAPDTVQVVSLENGGVYFGRIPHSRTCTRRKG